MNILVLDIGGTNVKVYWEGLEAPIKIPSGKTMTAALMVKAVKKAVGERKIDAVSIGYPGPVIRNKPMREPFNLGGGWVNYDFQKAFNCPVRIINDAAMQALGSYEGGHMLFLGLGTGLGATLILDGVIAPLEVAHLPYKHGKSFEDYVGVKGLKKFGKKKWRKYVADVVEALKAALQAEYVVLGGGNAKELGKLPPAVRLGGNAQAYPGGVRMWKYDPKEHDHSTAAAQALEKKEEKEEVAV
jgi:polyphosphate glucokinase